MRPRPRPGPLRRVLARLWDVGPGLFLAAALALGAIGALGTFATAVLGSEARPLAIRRGVTALGLSLTPLVCLPLIAIPIAFLATEVALACACFGVFVWILFYHEALQSVGGIPLNRSAYCTPVLFAVGAVSAPEMLLGRRGSPGDERIPVLTPAKGTLDGR